MSSYKSPKPRSSQTCQECRKRKLKCDRLRPACTRCREDGCTCSYVTNNSDSREIQFVDPRTIESESNRRSIQIQRFDKEVSAERLSSLEEHVANLTSLVRGLQQNVVSGSTVFEHPKDVTHPVKRARQRDSGEQVLSEDGGFLDAQGGGRTRYVSRAHWATIWDEVTEIEWLLRSQTRYELPNASHPSRPPFPFHSTLLSAPPTWDISHRSSSRFKPRVRFNIQNLPPQSSCDALFEAYVHNFHPIDPLTHIPTLRKEYLKFNEERNSTEDCAVTPMLSLIVTTLYAGSVVCTNEALRKISQTSDRAALSTNLHEIASSVLNLAQFPRAPTVESLSAYLILQGTWMREEEPLTTCSFVGVAVRVAQMLGLHKDPSGFGSRIAPELAEVRRRVWWHVFHVDVLIAVASGLPPLISRDSWDTKMVSEWHEEAMNTEIFQKYRDEPATSGNLPGGMQINNLISPMGIWVRGKLEDTDDIRIIQTELESLEREMIDKIRRIQQYRGSDVYEDNSVLNEWASVALSCLADKNWSFLGPPLYPTENQAWQNLVSTVLTRCCAFLEKYTCLACTPEFTRFQWAWPGNHQPLHALVMLLREANLHPTTPQVAIFRVAVDQTIALCSPVGGICGNITDEDNSRPLTEGGQEAWDFIRRLRTRAWIKAGLDPDVLTTREEVERQVGERLVAFRTFQLPEVLAPSARAESNTVNDVVADSVDIFGLGGVPTPNTNWDDWDSFIGTMAP